MVRHLFHPTNGFFNGLEINSIDTKWASNWLQDVRLSVLGELTLSITLSESSVVVNSICCKSNSLFFSNKAAISNYEYGNELWLLKNTRTEGHR
jgi:hypothetical protein